jgi:secondary thiamine-phosphate synthase enzyme
METGMIQELVIETRKSTELIDITSKVQSAVGNSGIKNGICLVYVPHTTVGLLINEHEPGLHTDLVRLLNQLVPEQGSYQHPDGNTHAHIKASLVGTSKYFVVGDGRLLLGTWQSIFLSEFDGPRSRKVFVKMVKG